MIKILMDDDYYHEISEELYFKQKMDRAIILTIELLGILTLIVWWFK